MPIVLPIKTITKLKQFTAITNPKNNMPKIKEIWNIAIINENILPLLLKPKVQPIKVPYTD
jgi:hypothetical protein